jgi:MoaA/NifB/PqqE/SkfB family radical SAM enzyme
MLEPMEESGLGLVVACALDAVGERHDAIRRFPGAWLGVDRSISGLVDLRSSHSNLVVGVKTTVLPENVGELEKIAEYARDRDLFTIISPAIVTAGRYLNPDKAQDLTLSAADRALLAKFYEGADFKRSYHAKALVHYLRTGRMEKPCSCGFNHFFVRSDGRVYLCPLFEEALGSILDGSLTTLFSSRRARETRGLIGKSPECRGCTEPGLERYSLPYEGFAYLRTLLRSGPRLFLERHRHLGLDKYV